MKINDPDIAAEVRAAFDRYERALMDNDLATLDLLFWDAPETVRYGPTETLYGFDAIQDFRKGRDASAIARRLDTVWICLLYTSPSPRDRTRSRMPSSA